MSNTPDPERLKELDSRIKAAKGEEDEQKTGDEAYNQASFAWQMVIELTVGLIIGFGIGYGLDSLFGTKPIFMVLFILLGFAAGMKVMLGTAAQMQKRATEAQDAQSVAQEEEETRG
ncbi:AtpZ/AtpI family protein [Aliiroseovarius sp. F20344]|uniref:AtpZ/AtpI family protein n=1 Tax=Aliiroseovarius sp. F20344 TaxID=2926414 RepID=UPI001FF1E996|nr:AtpZ/AtpI family protein [Aliiroseovarius sp. F20344]